jgi:hypothetical protein
MYIFTILDCFSHYPDAYPLQTATAKDCAECIFKWCSSNGVPQEIRSDGGSNLNISEIFKELYALLKIKSIVGNAYAPQANTVERFHRWLGAALRILLFDFDLDIDSSIPHCLWIWRATICRVTGFAPFLLHSGRVMRFPHDLYEGNVAQVSNSEYINHIKELTTTIWSMARNAQRISQLEAAHYYNIKHGIKHDIGTGDLVLRRKIPTNPTDVPSHLLPRCTGPYRVLKISSRGALLKHCTTGQQQRSSLRHLRRCEVRRDDEEYETDGALKHAANEYVIVRMTNRSGSASKWNVAKLLHPTPDEDGWVIQWCNTSETGPLPRLERRGYQLAWRQNHDGGSREVLAMNAEAGWEPFTWVVTLRRLLTPSFKLLKHGILPDSIKAIIRSSFESKYL